MSVVDSVAFPMECLVCKSRIVPVATAVASKRKTDFASRQWSTYGRLTCDCCKSVITVKLVRACGMPYPELCYFWKVSKPANPPSAEPSAPP